MEIYTRFNSDGKVIFHLLHRTVEDEYGNEKKCLTSNLPIEILKESYGEIVELFEKESRHLKKNKQQLLSILGDSIELNPNAKAFFYPEELLFSNILTETRLKNIIELQESIWVAPDCVFSKQKSTVRFYVLKCKFLRYQLYYPDKFISEIMPIERKEFEAQLNTEEMMIQYAGFLKLEQIQYCKTATFQGYTLFVLCIHNNPELFVVKR